MKTSLGAWRRSRADADDRSSNRRTLEGRRGSGIPQPGFSSKGRRSSSENRNSRISAIQPTLKRSRSQLNIAVSTQSLQTPIQRGSVGPFGSAASSRFVSPLYDGVTSKSGRGPSGQGNTNRVVRDTRPLTDKNYLHQEIQKVASFLINQSEFAPEGINLRQLTTKIFIDIFNHLIGFMDETITVTMSNYVTEIPTLMKALGYPGNLNTSWLKTVNTSHALPHVIGLFGWLVHFAKNSVSTDYSFAMQEALQQSSDAFPYGNAPMFLDFLMKRYKKWFTQDEAGIASDEALFVEALFERNGVSDENFKECAEVVHNYQTQLNDPKNKAAYEAALEEKKKLTEIVKDLQKCLDYKNQLEEWLSTAETELENEKQKLAKDEEMCTELQNALINLKDDLNKQTMTAQERDELLVICNELSSAIRENNEYIDAVSNQTYEVDLEMAKMRASIKKTKQAYNKIIVMESCWMQDLQALKDDTNWLHQGGEEESALINMQMVSLTNKVSKELQELHLAVQNLKAELLQVKERNSVLSEEYSQLKERKTHHQESIETFKTKSHEEIMEMKNIIESLKLSNEARLSCVSLEEARIQLQKLMKQREYGKEHIAKTKKKADSFFRKHVAITQKLMHNVLGAERKHFGKIEALIETARSTLEKTKTDFDKL